MLVSCFEDRDDNISPISTTLEIKDFVWKAMNTFYLYKDEVPSLADDRFSSDDEYRRYLESFGSPEELFGSLLFMPETVDRFSRIFDDFIELEQNSQGISKSNGIEYLFYRRPGTSDKVIAVVSLVIKGSPGADANVKRGQIVYAVDGVELTDNNFISLIFQDNVTLNFGEFDNNGTTDPADDFIVPNGESVTLNAQQFTENPIHVSKVLEVQGIKIGYLMYNRFNINFEEQLNDAFALFKSNNIDELVVDLRYNPGGQIATARSLASMITGQFTGEIFSKLVYNQDLSDNNVDIPFLEETSDGDQVNDLNLDRVYVIATNRSASASELLINSLGTYIDVLHIGTTTVGKTQASIPLYDSPDYTRTGRNPNHTYVLQPLIANSVNKFDEAVPPLGLNPDIEISEVGGNLGVLGDPEERLLAAAIAEITGTGRLAPSSTEEYYRANEIIIELPNTELIVSPELLPSTIFEN